ncbi:MAG: nitroreductase [Chloroflexi bacterium]|nr:nitroreductase [Chloroflexota bacterium]
MAVGSGDARPDQTRRNGSSDDLEAVGHVIRGRRSVRAFARRPVARTTVLELLELAVWAPNHHLTEPWRFYVVDGSTTRTRLANIGAALFRGDRTLTPADAERRAVELAQVILSVPTLVLVTCVRDRDREIDLENYAATCCAVQNLLLAATAAGLGSFWNTGRVAQAEATRELLGVGTRERVVGLIYLGYPAPAVASRASRRPASEHTRWVDAPAVGGIAVVGRPAPEADAGRTTNAGRTAAGVGEGDKQRDSEPTAAPQGLTIGSLRRRS